ncbi:Solute carrier family 26 member 6 [Echinococcus granulosus]|nr:Solute carrier family 26 member 6 [Echinococcus granulosus]
MSDEEYAFRLDLALTLAFCVGVLQIIMALLQVGFLAAYLSGPLISGFMCASAFHIMASQFNYLFGIKLPRVYGPGNLLLVVLSTVISHFVGFSSRWGVNVIGKIPSGLPAPVVPTFAHFADLVSDTFVIGIIVFAINAGLVKTYASEFGYDVLDNQELLALGISNTFASFFQCHTASGALARTAVVATIGMASQAVLGCIVCVALTSTFKKVLDLKRLWKVSKIDASIWLVSFLTTFAVDITYGIGVGFVYSILTVVSRSQYGGRFLLGEARNSDLYSELKRFEELCPIIVWALQMIKKYTEVEVTILVAALRPRLREMFANSGVFSLLSEENFFVSVHDAVLVALAELHSTTTVAAADGDGMGERWRPTSSHYR